MANQATITGKEMGAIAVTAKVMTNTRSILIDQIRQMIFVTQNDGFVQEFDVSAATTVTCTITAGTFAFTIS